MARDIPAFLAHAAKAKSGRELADEIASWARAGEFHSLLELSARLDEQGHSPEVSDRLRRLSPEIERALAQTPGLPALEALLRFVQSKPPNSVPPACAPAANAASASAVSCLNRDASVILELVSRHGADVTAWEFLACLIQEWVIRGFLADEYPQLRDFHRRLDATRHMLGWLPLRLQPEEVWLPHLVPTVSPSHVDQVRIAGFELYPAVGALPGECGNIAVREVTSVHEADRMAEAVGSWLTESNGRSEARVFTLPAPFAEFPGLVPLLLGLPLACLAGAGPDTTDAVELEPAQAFNHLFSSAKGGAYSGARSPAYARVHAWRSFAALAGLPEVSTVLEIGTAARRCRWHSFQAWNDWFYDVAWDLGLLVLRPDGRTVAILAASDTD